MISGCRYIKTYVSVLGERGLESNETKAKAAKQKMVKHFQAKQQTTNSIIEHPCNLSLKYISRSLFQRFFSYRKKITK